MLDAFLQAFVTVLSGQHILFLSFCVAFGLVVGVLPGFGGSVGLALLLPFVSGMDPTAALALMIGLLSVVSPSDPSLGRAPRRAGAWPSGSITVFAAHYNKK